MTIYGIVLFLLILLVVGAVRIYDAVKYPERWERSIRERYGDRIDRFSGKSPAQLLATATEALSSRRAELDEAEKQLEALRSEMSRTALEIFDLASRLTRIGLVQHNRRKYILDLCFAFASGVLASLVASFIWAHFFA